MQPGRTPTWNVFADLEPRSWLEVVEMASADRLPMPLELRRRVSWGAPKASLSLLGRIDADGSVTIAPMSDRQDELAAVRSAIGAQRANDRGDLVFAAIATYSQLTLQPDGRLRMSPMLVRHLGGEGGSVWLGAHDDELRLWSQATWEVALSKVANRLRGAVGGVVASEVPPDLPEAGAGPVSRSK